MACIMEGVGWHDLLADEYMKQGLFSSTVRGGEMFLAYGGAYVVRHFGAVELVAHVKPSHQKPDEFAAICITGHCTGETFWQLTLHDGVSLVSGDRNDSLSRCVLMENEQGRVLPVHMVMPCVLPGFQPKQPVLMQMTAMPVYAETAHPEGTLSRSGVWDSSAFQDSRNTILVPNTRKEDWEKLFFEENRGVYIRGIVEDSHFRKTGMEDLSGNMIELSDFFRITVKTDWGMIDMPVCREMLGYDPAAILPGDLIQALAVLSGNVQVGRYSGGMICHPDEYLLAVRYAVRSGDTGFLSSVVADEWLLKKPTEKGMTEKKENGNGLSSFCEKLHDVDMSRIIRFTEEKADWGIGRGNHAILLDGDRTKNGRRLLMVLTNEQDLVSGFQILPADSVRWEMETEIYREE